MEAGQVIEPSAGEWIRCERSGRGGGAFEFLMELAPKKAGPPFHSHDEGDETIAVTEGELLLQLVGEAKLLRAGERYTIPKGVPHTFANPSDTQVVKCQVEHGARFERALEQPDFTRLAMYLTFEDPGASRMWSRAVRWVLALVAWSGRVRGVRVAG